MATTTINVKYYLERKNKTFVREIEVDLEGYGCKPTTKWGDLTKEKQEEIQSSELEDYIWEIQSSH